jgi:hypothetical protein
MHTLVASQTGLAASVQSGFLPVVPSLLAARQATQVEVAEQAGVAAEVATHAPFWPLVSLAAGTQVTQAWLRQAFLPAVVQAGFTPPLFCASRQTTQALLLGLQTGVVPPQSALLAQPKQTPLPQIGLEGSVQSAEALHSPQ